MNRAAILISIALSPAVHAQVSQDPSLRGDPQDVVRVETTLVTVPVRVTDRNGGFVPGLTREQFHLYEDGVEQEIAYFETSEKPFTVALLLDISDSTRLKLKDIQDAALEFVDQLRPDDRVLVIAFDRYVKLVSEGVNDRQKLKNAIYAIRSGGGTSLYNALDITIKQRLNQISGRKAIILFSDGVDTTSAGATYESTIRQAQELDALVYSIQYDTNVTSPQMTTDAALRTASNRVTARGEFLNVAYARGSRYLRLMADQSGGRFYYAANAINLKQTFARIAAELRQQYSLGYYPKKKTELPETRLLKVRVTVPNLIVRARKTLTM